MPPQDTTPKAPGPSSEPLQPMRAAAWDASSPASAGPMAAAGIAPPAQAAAVQAVHGSPRMMAQRRQLRAAFGPRHVPEDGPVQRAEDGSPVKNTEVVDGDDGEYVLVELNPGSRVPHAADVADLLDRQGLFQGRTRDSEPLQLEDFGEAVEDAVAGAPGGGRASEAALRGLKNGRVEVHEGGRDRPAQVIIGPFPPGMVEEATEYSAEDLLFSDNAAASGDHGAITDTRAASGDGIWSPR